MLRSRSLCSLLATTVGLSAALAACGHGDAAVEKPAPFGPETDARAREPDAPLPALHDGNLTFANNGVSTPVRRVLLLIDGGFLKVVGSTSTIISCDSPAAPLGASSFEASIDPGPLGDFYVGHAVPALISLRAPGDPIPVRDVYPAASQVQIDSFKPGDERAMIRIEARRMLMRPDPHAPRLYTITGRTEAIVCPSFSAQPVVSASSPDGPVRMQFGERSLVPGSVLAFREPGSAVSRCDLVDHVLRARRRDV